MQSHADSPADRRESLRCDLQLPLRWCRLEGQVTMDGLANALDLQGWFARQQVLAELDTSLAAELEQVQDIHAAAALRMLERAVRRLAGPDDAAASLGALVPVNVSIDGVSFSIPATDDALRPQDWLGLAIVLPDGSPLMSCLEVVWVGETEGQQHVGGRFHHVSESMAKRLARTLLLESNRTRPH